MKILFWSLTGLLAVLLLTFSVEAREQEGHGPPPGGHLQRFDTDKDGKVSESEWIQHHTERFTEIDTDGDGYLSEEEMETHHSSKRKKPRRS